MFDTNILAFLLDAELIFCHELIDESANHCSSVHCYLLTLLLYLLSHPNPE